MTKSLRPLKISIFLVFLLSNLLPNNSTGQSVTGIYTDFAGWWASSVATPNTVKPNDKNNLIGFTTIRTIGGVPTNKTFSTGVNDNLLTSKGVTFTPGDYRALPVGAISGSPGTSTYVGIGSNYGGVNQANTHPALTNPMNYYLTDGEKGLDMGTAVFNIQSGSIFYKVDEFNIAAIGDGMPDIIATQMGDYPSTNDIFKFVDVNGITVGNQLSLNFSQVLGVGSATWAFYQVPTATTPQNPLPMPYGGPHGDRLIRLQAWDLSDFGLNQGNVGRISRFVHTLSGNSDPAFMAYNTTGLRALTTIIPGCGTTTPGLWLQGSDGITAENGKVTRWNDQSSKALHVEQLTTANKPTYNEGKSTVFNFNPYIDFDNGNRLGHSNSPFTANSDNFDVFIVARPNANSGNNKILGFSRNNTDESSANRGDYPAFNFNSNGQLDLKYGNETRTTAPTSGSTIPGLWQMSYTRGSGNITSTLNGASPSVSNGTMDLGTWYTQFGDLTPGDNQSDFDLAEVIVFPSNISSDQKQKTSSYLAVKYGISLPFSYVSGSGQTIWDYSNNIYNNHIIGVGREDCQGLSQKQSSSISDPRQLLTIGMTNIASSTKENLTTMADGQYMLWGDNNGSLTNFTSFQAQQLCLKRPDITWRNQRTGAMINTQNTQVKFHVSEIPWAEGTTSNSAGNYYLLIDRNANGSYQDAGDVAIPATSLAAGFATFDNVIWDNDGSGTDLFTVALKVGEVPVLTAITGSNTACIGSTIALTNSVTGGVWSSSNPSVATINAETGIVTGVHSGKTTVSYTVTNSKGCATTITKDVTVNEIPTATISGGGTVCGIESLPNVSINFTGTGPWSVIYTNGSNSTSLTNVTTNPYVIAAASPGTYTITALSNATCAGTFNGTVAVAVISPPVANVTQPACPNDNGSIEITQPLGADITYSINGEDYQTSPIFPNLAPGSYSITAKNNSCESLQSVATINASPTAPTPVVTQPTCAVPTGTITIPAVNGATYSINEGDFQSNNIFNTLTPGDYSIDIKSGSNCEIHLQNVTIQSQPETPSAPTVHAVNYCKGASPVALRATGSNLLWYTSAEGGVGNSAAPVPGTETIGTKVYYVSQTNQNGCESPRASLEVTVKSVPSAPIVDVINNCNGTSNLTASNYTGSLLWSNGQTTQGITVNTAGTYTVTQNIDGCVSPAASVAASPKSIPATPVINVVNNCNNTSVITATNTTGTLLWSNGSNLTSQTVNIADTYYLVQTINGCTSAPANATTAPRTTPSAPTVMAVQNCGSSVLTATGAGNILWSNGMTTNSITVTNAASFTVNRTVNGCVSPTASISSAPAVTAAPTGNSTQVFCAKDAPKIANLTAVGSDIKWYATSSGGTALASSIALIHGTTYYASQTGAGCESANRFAVTVTINASAAPIGNTVQAFCKSENPTISSLAVTGADIKWYNTTSGGTALAASTSLEDGQTFYASQTLNGCESVERLAVKVAITEAVAPTANETTQHFCTTDAPTLAELTVSGIDLKWYDAPDNGNILELNTVLENGKTYYASQTNGNCESARLAISVILDQTPSISDAGADQKHCNADEFTMAANTPVIGNGSWKLVSGNAKITDMTSPNTTVIVEAGQSAELAWTVTNGNCSSNSSVLLSNSRPVSAGEDQSQTSNTFFMEADESEGLWQIISVLPEKFASSIEIADPTLFNTTVTAPAGATVTLSWTATGSACSDEVVLESTGSLPVTLISFVSAKQNTSVDLKWSTSSETNNLGFDIERSSDAKSFSVIGFVAAKTEKDSKVRQDYIFTDNEPLTGVNYYRLAQKDIDGTVSYSRIVTEQFVILPPAIELYPNPSSDFIHFKNFSKGSKVSLIDNAGVTISTSNDPKLDVRNLVQGMYYIRVENAGSIQTLKFMKD